MLRRLEPLGWWSLQSLPTLMISDLGVCAYEMAPGEQVQRREEGRGVWGWGRVTGEPRTPALEGSSYLHRKGKVISLTSFLPGLVMPPWFCLTSVNHSFPFSLVNGFLFPKHPSGPL